jgi:hypothetical protein
MRASANVKSAPLLRLGDGRSRRLVVAAQGELGALAIGAEAKRPALRAGRVNDEIEPGAAAVGNLEALGRTRP